MSTNSVQTVTLNSALSLKLGWVHSAHTQKLGRVRSAHVVGAAARTASAGRAHARRALVVTRPGSLSPGRDLTSMSRHQGGQNHVATSNRCHDTTQTTPCRDIKSVSRHQIVVATSFLMPSPLPMSRHQTYPSHCHPCRDIQFMSRHQAQSSHCRPCRDILVMSRHQACSATSLLRRDAKRCRDLTLSGPCIAHLAPCLLRPRAGIW